MKIMHLLFSDRLSGAENVAISIIENISDKHDFVYVSKKGPIEDVLKEKGINYQLFDKINLKSVKKALEDINPDIIHAHDYFASTYAALSGFKGKIISHQHSDISLAKKWNKYMLVFSVALRRIDKIIFVSSDIPKNVVYKNKIKNKMEVIPNIVDKEKLLFMAKEKTDEKSDALYIGRLSEEKNPYEFIEIIKKLSEKKSDIKAVIIGDGVLKEKCGEKIKELGLEENIELKGFLKNPFPFVKNTTCVIMPSKYEGLSLGAVECLILKKPVFNGGVSGFNDIYNGKNIYLCKDIDEYAEKVLRYIKNPVEPEVDLRKFTDKKEYYKKIRELYES